MIILEGVGCGAVYLYYVIQSRLLNSLNMWLLFSFLDPVFLCLTNNIMAFKTVSLCGALLVVMSKNFL